jgi:hypothetical protein
MSGTRELQSVDIAPPFESDVDNPGPSGSYSRALAAASTRYEIPAKAKGNFWSMIFSADVQMSFGDADVAVTRDQDSTVASEVLTPSAATGYRFMAGIEYHFRIPKHKSITHFALLLDNAAAAGRWWGRISNNIIVDD